MAGLWAGLGVRCELAKREMQQLGATSKETARKPEQLGIDAWILDHYLAKIRGIKRTEDGRYYVEAKNEEHY